MGGDTDRKRNKKKTTTSTSTRSQHQQKSLCTKEKILLWVDGSSVRPSRLTSKHKLPRTRAEQQQQRHNFYDSTDSKMMCSPHTFTCRVATTKVNAQPKE